LTKFDVVRLSCFAVGWTCLALQTASPGESQSSGGATQRSFEVASVKRVPKDMGAYMRGGPGSGDPGRIAYHSTPWESLLRRAFAVKADQLVCPGWMKDGLYFYDIDATIPPGSTEEQFRAMLRDLLAQRFHLAYHRSTKRFPGYELRVASGGLRIRLSDIRSVAPGDSQDGSKGLIKTKAEAKSDFPVLMPGQKYKVNSPPLYESGVFRVSFRGSIPELVEQLPYLIMYSNRETGWPRYRVADRTALDGEFDFKLEFYGGATLDGGGPSIFRAVERQLGLTLNKTDDIAVEVIVVDSADKIPTEN
jgi:uncharacterized protein (TIGR03435 family)